MKVLIIDDEPSLLDTVEMAFQLEGHTVFRAECGRDGLALFHSEQPDFIVLDRMMPDGDGLEVCQQVRLTSSVPILMLTARDGVDDRVGGLDSGADDYLAKPFRVKELMARVRALRRRSTVGPMTDALEYGPLRLDPAFRCVVRGDKTSELTATEYQLLAFLVEHPRQVFSKSQLLDRVWGWDAAQNENVVEAHVSSLRAKIGDNSRQLIRTVRGLGYVLGA